MRKMFAILTALTLAALSWPVLAFEPNVNDAMELDVQRAIINIKKADPESKPFLRMRQDMLYFPV